MSTDATRGRRGRFGRWLALGAGLLLVLVVALFAALRLPAVQRALFERAAVAIEGRTGARLTAGVVRLSPWRGRLELERVALAAGNAEPFLTADGLAVELAPRSLMRGPLRLREVHLAGPRFDGSRPLPEPPPAAAEEPAPGAPAIVVERLTVRGGSAGGVALPEGLAPYIEGLALAGLDLDGALEDGRLRLGLSGARLAAARPGATALELRLAGDLAGPIEGPFELESLRLEGPELALRLSGQLGIADDQPLALSLELETDLAALLAAAAPAGTGGAAAPAPSPAPLEVSGRIDLRATEGELRIEAAELPAELLRPWLDAALYRQAALAGTDLTVVADLRLGGGELTGETELYWRRGGRTLAAADLVLATTGELAELAADLELTLLPAAPGRRRLAARLAVPRAEPAAAVIERGRLELRTADLAAELARLQALWPALVPELPDGLASGSLRADAGFSGKIEDPTVGLEGEWTPSPGAALDFDADGRPLARRLRARLGIRSLPLETLTGGAAAGTIDGAADLEMAGERLGGSARLVAAELKVGELVIDRTELSAELAGRRLELHRLEAAAGERRLTAAGTAELGDDPRAEVGFEFAGPLGPVSAARGALWLADGGLELDLAEAAIGGATATAGARAPLATLARLPGGEGIAALPGRHAEGPLELEWRLPELDWAETLGLDAGTEEAVGAAVSEAAAGEDAASAVATIDTAPADAEAAGAGVLGKGSAARMPRRWRAGSHGRLTVDPAAPAAVQGEIEITGLELREGDHEVIAEAPLRLTLGGGRLELEPVTLAIDGKPVELAAGAGLRAGWRLGGPPEELLAEARLVARAIAPEPLADVRLELALRDGHLFLDGDLGLGDAGRGRLEAEAPVAALLGEGAPPDAADRTVRLRWELPPADWAAWLGEPPEGESRRLLGATRGSLELDTDRPPLAAGELVVPVLELELGEQTVRADEPIVLRLGGGRLDVAAFRLLASGAPLELTGGVELDPDWQPDRPPAALVRSVALRGGGTVPAALANPFLAGGAGEGPLALELELDGPVDALAGELRLRGPEAGFLFAAPYTVELTSPEVTVAFEGGALELSGTAGANEGRLRFTGRAAGDGGLSLAAVLEDVRARLDYGLLVLVDGDLRLELEPTGGGRLAGTVTVDRGELTRPLRLDSLLLAQLFAPAELIGTEWDPLEGIELDLTLATREGVRVKNNLADLKVRWEPVAVRGSLAQPIIEGRLEVNPGGLVYAYGQTVRLDSAAMVYHGLPQELPELEIETTTSLEDPSIGQLAGDVMLTERGGEQSASDPLASGLGAFLGEQLAGSLGDGARISFRAPLIFGETDPGARFTVSSDVSANATLAASVDLRNAERQTYLLDLHGFEAAPLLTGQLFTTDLGEEGLTLQQRLHLGGARRQQRGPRLRRLEVDPVPGVRRRALRRAVGYGKGDRLADGAAFDAQVAVSEMLRGRGFPDARVRARQQPAPAGGRVDLEVRIDSGPRVEYEFTGERLPKPLRRAITGLYRGDFYEPLAIEEMRAEAVRAWRSRGHLDPEVTIAREVVAAGPSERRRVTIDSRPGPRIELTGLEFAGLPPAESAEMAALFASRLQRVELAAGLEAAERRARAGLAALGYSEATISGRELTADGERLTVRVEPGRRLRVTVLELVETRSGMHTEVGEAGGVAAGDPARSDRLALAALEVERQLRDSGYLEAEVTVRLEPVGAEEPDTRRAVFELDRGPLYRLAGVEFDGLRGTRKRWARRRADLEPDRPLSPRAIADARRRLYGTGLFSVVGSDTRLGDEEGAIVRFEVEEEPRFRIAYGLRWESEEGSSVVVDLLDHNFLGRGADVALRALYAEEFQQLRLSGVVPGVLGPKSQLELFAAASDEEELVEDEDDEVLAQTRTVEGTVQLGWQFGARTTGRVYGRWRDIRATDTFLVEDPVFGLPDPIEIEVRQPILGLQYIFDGRDDRASPRRGLFASADLSYSDENLGGDIRYWRLFTQLHSFRPAGRLAGRALTWAQSVRLGRAEALAGQQLLGDVLLRAGGEYSVRGYRRESLGPPALLRRVLPAIQDNSLFVLNEELRFELWEPVSGLLFFDAGNVWIDDDALELDLFTSLGLGVRAATPFGLLRLDVAFPLDARPGVDSDVKLYFGLGNVF